MPETATFDHYEVLTRDDGSLYELGRGAMGVTYKAFDTSLRFPVCLKVINSTYLNSEIARQRFIREARSAAKLRHRNVASVFHLGTEGDTWFYAMEFIDGETLEAVIKREGTLSPRAALEITAQVARALNAASQHGLVHRDIKPANLMLVHEDDEVVAKVIDFGLAKTSMGEGEDAATLSLGGFVGTPHFASPEQLEERDLDVRSDIYSLGITLWYMLAGQPPFGGSMAQVMSQHLSKPPPFEKMKAQQPMICELLRKMLEKDPAARFQTPAELRRAVEDVMGRMTNGPAADRPMDPIPSSGGTSTPGQPADEQEFATLLETAAKRPGETRFEAGVTIAGRYRIVEALGETNAGRVFRAQDESHQRDVRMLVLHRDFLNDSQNCTALEREVEQLIQVQHSNILGVYDFETIENASFLAMEWTNGFTLLELLRARRELGAEETITLLRQAAVGVDYAVRRSLTGLEFGLHQILVSFGQPIQKDVVLRQPMAQWPDFTLKLYPLGVARNISSAQTWAGAQTMVEGATGGAPEVGDVKGRYIRALAAVVYELLGGTLSPLMQGGAGLASSRYTPLSTLSEEGNEVLKHALDPAFSYESALAFCNALGQLDGLQVAHREPIPAPYKTKSGSASTPGLTSATGAASTAGSASTAGTGSRAGYGSTAPVSPIAQTVAPVAPPTPAIPPQPHVPPKKGGAPVALILAVVAVLGLGGGGAYYVMHKPGGGTTTSDNKQGDDHSGDDAKAQEEKRLAAEKEKAEQEKKDAEAEAKRKADEEAARMQKEKETAAQSEEARKEIAVALQKATQLEKVGDVLGAMRGYVDMINKYPGIGADAARGKAEGIFAQLHRGDLNLKLGEAEKFLALAKEAADLAVVPAMSYIGEDLLKKDKLDEAYPWYQKAADAGDTEGIVHTADFNYTGIPGFLVPDKAKAVELYEKAADRGNVRAKASLGNMYLEGRDVPKNEVKGLKFMREATADMKTDPKAMNFLGNYLISTALSHPEADRKKDYDEAFRLFTAAKDQGYFDALGNLGVMYMNGTVPGAQAPDPKRGVSMFLEGAKLGNGTCMFFYAKSLEAGIIGGKPNPKDAEEWYVKAAKAGNPAAQQWCKAHKISVPMDLIRPGKSLINN